MAGLINGLRPDKLVSVWTEIEDFYDEWGRYMCCWTHEYRDMLAQDLYEPVELVAYSSVERCQCKLGNPVCGGYRMKRSSATGAGRRKRTATSGTAIW